MTTKRRLDIAAYVIASVAVVLATKAAHTILSDPAMYTSIGPDGRPAHASLVQINGEGVIPKVWFPVALVLAAIVLPWRPVRIGLTILLWLFVILGGMTIGLYYFRAAVAMLIATACWVAAVREA